MRLLLVGNYGVGNIGDEALRMYFLERFPDVEWSVLSAQPQKGEYARFPLGIRSIIRPWWKTLQALRASDGMFFGGGTLFTDVESVRACLLWGMHAAVARALRKPIYLAFQGIGPFRTATGAFLAARVLRSATFISVRDHVSAERVLTLSNKKCIQTFDPIFAYIEEEKAKSEPFNVFTIIPRKNSPNSFLKRAAELIGGMPGTQVRILSLQPDNSGERKVCEQLARTTGGVIIPVRTMADLKQGVSGSAQVLSQRYHGAVAALSLGIPVEVVPQGKGDKLDALPAAAEMSDVRASIARAEDALREALGLPIVG